MGFFSKRANPTSSTPMFEPSPQLTDGDLASASNLMDRWDNSLGNSDATWACMEAIAQQGGFKGMQAVMTEVMNGRDTGDVIQRPWRWWCEAARVAHAGGNDVLAGRIFLFTYLFVNNIAPSMNGNVQADVGLTTPTDDLYKEIAASGAVSLARLSPSLMIHDSATGKVDVENALRLAEQVSGLSVPRNASSAEQPPPTGNSTSPGPFNTL